MAGSQKQVSHMSAKHRCRLTRLHMRLSQSCLAALQQDLRSILSTPDSPYHKAINKSHNCADSNTLHCLRSNITPKGSRFSLPFCSGQHHSACSKAVLLTYMQGLSKRTPQQGQKVHFVARLWLPPAAAAPPAEASRGICSAAHSAARAPLAKRQPWWRRS